MGILADKIASEFVPGRKDFLLFHFVERLALFEGLLDGVGGFVKHPHVSSYVVDAGQVTVPGDHFHVSWQLRDDALTGSDNALYAAAAVDVDKREAVADEVVAHVHHVRLRVKDDRVSVRVASGKVKGADVLSVQVHGNVMLEGNDGQRGLRRWLVLHVDGSAVACWAARRQPLTNVVLGNDGRALAELGIPTRMVAVIVSVDNETHRLVRASDASQADANLLGQRGKLVVYDGDSVVAHGGGDVAALPLQHINAAGHRRDFDLNLAEILLPLPQAKSPGRQ